MRKLLILLIFLSGCGCTPCSKYYQSMAKLQDSSYTFKERQKAWQDMRKYQWYCWEYRNQYSYNPYNGLWR